MKKISFELIKKIDFVLIFIFLILGIVTWAIVMIDAFNPFGRHTVSNGVTIVADDPKEEIREYIEFNKKIKDVFIFNLKSSKIKADGLYDNIPEAAFKSGTSFSKKSHNEGITNLIFINDTSYEEYKLFDSNIFIYRYKFSEEKTGNNIYCDKNIYAVVNEDTNNDNTLNSEDNIALYISDYNGKNLIKLSNSIYKVRITDNNQLLFTEYDGSVLTFFSYDINLNKKTKLKSAEQETPEKYISFY
ncbi:hypothetical protein [Treponema putidum]|uniref:Uncharacterized protein n=1 Tax=Treponema putidum TaxID=221027 RepID=A0AAE9SJ57_9SPIR|nr:hypothetical protein [Treponema putidum]AIN93634.1 hypothetical protein JO40_05495 [Treponema putidum]TWI77720.1 hypothetical protein JM98_01028 [Treponema putidum]UTY32334.1 hypothetical protein E4N75_13350 [Treponema putidum]UTY34740.1 hypothetical protein E4N74_12550 [Treponema putidum]